MSLFPELEETAASRDVICVVDTSVLIEFKRLVKIDEQWSLLTRMLTLVEDGSLTFPRQVSKELQAIKFPDAPGAWIGHAKNKEGYAKAS